jgi:hypothetical protein
MRTVVKLMVGVAALLIAPAAQAQKVPNPDRDSAKALGEGGLEGEALARAIRYAEDFPLGSENNPIRENQPEGEYAYLARLRCADGSAPDYGRVRAVGGRIYGNIVDQFVVECAGKLPVTVYIDMYQDGPETRPIPGFTMAK